MHIQYAKQSVPEYASGVDSRCEYAQRFLRQKRGETTCIFQPEPIQQQGMK